MQNRVPSPEASSGVPSFPPARSRMNKLLGGTCRQGCYNLPRTRTDKEGRKEKNLSYMKQAYNSTLHMYLYLSSGRLVVVWWLLGACSSHPSSSSSSSGAVDLASQTLVPSPLLCSLEFWEQLFFVIGHELFAATSGRQRHRDDEADDWRRGELDDPIWKAP